VGPDLSYNGGHDGFVAKLRADGTGLVYAGFLGGSSRDYGYGIAVDAAGNAYATGGTWSTDFPTLVGPDLSYNGGDCDGFVAKLRADGTGLVYSGFLGGSGSDWGNGIAVDGAGNAYATGGTWSTDFPTLVGPDLSYNGGNYDGFVAKVNSDGTGLVLRRLPGRIGNDTVWGIAVDHAGNAYVTGCTDSRGFPVVVGPDLSYNGGNYDGFVAKVRADGTGLAYSGFLGGWGDDYGEGIAVDAAGNAYATAGPGAATSRRWWVPT